jgi:hypothetical protein
VESAWRDIVQAAGVPAVIHCCSAQPPLRLMRDAGAVAVSVDLSLLTARTALDELGELLDGGTGLFAGAVPSTGAGAPSPVSAADAVSGLWRRLGLPVDQLARQVVVTPTCGLAGATPGYARAAIAACVEGARRFED